MAAIFISHSSKDVAAVGNMQAWLQQNGHRSLFLDHDQETGIAAGALWEQTLYDNLRQCQVVIALLTRNWVASKWCFAEIVYARAQGKTILPVRVERCEAEGVLSDTQVVDLTTNADEGYRRLNRALLDVFDWDTRRPPYPGLMAFQEEDAGVFFGRSLEVRAGLEKLASLRRQGRAAPRFVLFLGASGSGKSSLVRAGILPRLRREPYQWLPIQPFRPQSDAIQELTFALTASGQTLGRPPTAGEIQDLITPGADDSRADGSALLDFARGLRLVSASPDATVLLIVDQAEELLVHSDAAAAHKADRLFRLLRAALEQDQQLMVLATLRSDFLANFQTHPFLLDPAYAHPFAYAEVTVDPMGEERFREVIRGPAERAGLRFDDRLVDRMVHDTGARDALPLLAFTLRRLWENHSVRVSDRVALPEYEAMGGLEGALQSAADEALDKNNRTRTELDLLHAAFVPTMVRINSG